MGNIMFCLDLNEVSFNRLLKELPNLNLGNAKELHLVHGFTQQLYADNFLVSSYPNEEQFDDVEKSVLQFLTDFEDQMPQKLKDLKVTKACRISPNPKTVLAEYAKEHDIDTMFIVTRGVHGVATLFNSSFAEYMIRHAECELRILRNT